MSDVTVRAMREGEEFVWLEWRMRVLADVFEHMGYFFDARVEVRNAEYIEKHFADGTCIACFAEQGGEIIGCGAACIMEELPSPDNMDGRCAYLMNIYVVPEERRQGTGRMIVRWLLDQVASMGISKVMLETTREGRTLYEECGFHDADGYMILGHGDR